MSSSEQISSIDDTPATPAPSAAPSKGKARAAAAAGAGSDAVESDGPKRRMLTIHASGDEAGQNAVEVGVNGVVYQIPRSTPCAVPEEVIEALTNAEVSIYKTTDGVTKEHKVPRFAFTVTD